MMFQKFSFGCLPLCFVLSAHAGDMGKEVHDYVISISGGPAWTDAGSTQVINLQPDITQTYVPNNLTNFDILGNGEIFAGMQKSLSEHVRAQLGLAFYVSSPAILNGVIQEDNNPGFQNFSYRYKISHKHLAVKTKWISENSFNLNPYLSASIGVGFNQSYDYSSTPVISQEIPVPPFQPRDRTVFSYSVGAGFQHRVNQHVAVALGYQLVSWGESSLAPAFGQTSGSGLSMSNLYTHGLEFNVSYLS